MFLNIACHLQDMLFGMALMWPLRKEREIDIQIKTKKEKKIREEESGGVITVSVTTTRPPREDTYATDWRTLHAVALTDSFSYGDVPLYLWWQPSCPAQISTFR